MQQRIWQVLAVGWFIVLSTAMGCVQPSATSEKQTSRSEPIPGGVDAPVTRSRLFPSAYLQGIDGNHEWVFKEREFVLTAVDGREIPPDLRNALLGSDRAADHIVGAWEFDEKDGQLIFTDIVAAGAPGRSRVTLSIGSAGLGRVNIYKWQYNLFRKKPT